MTLRIFYSAGSGDVVNSFNCWERGIDDPTELSVTYSSQFFSVCEDIEANALIVTSNPNAEDLKVNNFEIVNRKILLNKSNGIFYHVGQVLYSIILIKEAIKYKADLAILGGVSHWYLFSVLKVFGIKVVPTLHCAFWPQGYKKETYAQKVLRVFDGLFWRYVADATICVSPECERQVINIAKNVNGPIYQSRAFYRRCLFDKCSASKENGTKVVLMYAGRIEKEKGVFRLLSLVAILEKKYPHKFLLKLYGKGSAEGELGKSIRCQGLEKQVIYCGRKNRDELIKAFYESDIVIVPTTKYFAEGLNKVCVEGVLSCRPVVTTTLSNANDVIGDAIVCLENDDIESYANAIEELIKNNSLYSAKVEAAKIHKEIFFDPKCSWGTSLKKAIRDLN